MIQHFVVTYNRFFGSGPNKEKLFHWCSVNTRHKTTIIILRSVLCFYNILYAVLCCMIFYYISYQFLLTQSLSRALSFEAHY
jgi:hypothetical protein